MSASNASAALDAPIESDNAHGRSYSECDTPENIREPMLANVYPVRGGDERPADAERGGLTGC